MTTKRQDCNYMYSHVRRKHNTKEAKLDCSVLAAKLFCGIEQLAPVKILVEKENPRCGIKANDKKSDDKTSASPQCGRHWFGYLLCIVMGTNATVWDFMSRVLYPLATASYQNDTGLIIPNVSPNSSVDPLPPRRNAEPLVYV
jgi:hypothetical protein